MVGGFLASLVLAPSVTLGAAVMSGIGFAVCQLVLVDVLARLYPDREMLVQGFAGALVIGAISMGFGKRHDPNR